MFVIGKSDSSRPMILGKYLPAITLYFGHLVLSFSYDSIWIYRDWLNQQDKSINMSHQITSSHLNLLTRKAEKLDLVQIFGEPCTLVTLLSTFSQYSVQIYREYLDQQEDKSTNFSDQIETSYQIM